MGALWWCDPNGYCAEYRRMRLYTRLLFRQYKLERWDAFWASIFEAFE